MKSLSKLSDTMNNTTFQIPVYLLLIMIALTICLGLLIGLYVPVWLNIIIIVTCQILTLVIALIKVKGILNKQGN